MVEDVLKALQVFDGREAAMGKAHDEQLEEIHLQFIEPSF
jgi:hypothetical protein